MLENIFEMLFVLSLVAPIAALVAGVLMLAMPAKSFKQRVSTTKVPAHA